MKKTIILILLLLPFVLLMTIAVAGRILSIYNHIAVENVTFTEGTAVFDWTEEYQTSIKITPELASNQNVTYTSDNTDICEVDGNGILKGNAPGTTIIRVTTEDGNKTATLSVTVTADVPIKLNLNPTEVTMKVGGNQEIKAEVITYAALDKTVTYSSSNPDIVSVSAQGKLTANAIGVATITATTVSGGITATCTVTVEPGAPPIDFDFSGIETISKIGNFYVLSAAAPLDLVSCLRLDEHLSPDDITFAIEKGAGYASLHDGVLTIHAEQEFITVIAYAGSKADPAATATIKFVLDVQDEVMP